MKVRSGFISNSSSSSYIIIDYDSFNPPKLDEILYVNEDFGETEFGWGPDTIYGYGSRIIFSYLQTLYSYKNKTRLKMLEDSIKNNCGVKKIYWEISTGYSSDEVTHPETKNKINWGYIDHQSSAVEGGATEMFDSQKDLEQFLFGKNSRIELDHDNH